MAKIKLTMLEDNNQKNIKYTPKKSINEKHKEKRI